MPTQPPPVWTPSDLAEDPHKHAEKAEKVRTMFGAIARTYDLNNRLHSFGRDQAWRRAAVRLADVKPTDRVLDCACGTGDLTRAFADAGAKAVTGLDFTPEMLEIARSRRLSPQESTTENISYVQGDAQKLPFEDESFDIVSIAFGIRNVARPPQALTEFRRVLRSGGRLIILEFGRPRLAPIRFLNNIYTRHIMPRTASLISRDKSGAYRYLPRSVETFLSVSEMSDAMAAAGFKVDAAKRMTFGVCIAYRGRASEKKSVPAAQFPQAESAP